MNFDLSDSVPKWEKHFVDMAQGKIPTNQMYMLNQKGKGLGTFVRGKALYRIQTGGQTPTQTTNNKVANPANRGYAMARARIRNAQRKRSSTSKSRSKSIKGRKRRSKSRITSKPRRRKISNKKSSKRTSKVKKLRTTRRRIRKRDIFR